MKRLTISTTAVSGIRPRYALRCALEAMMAVKDVADLIKVDFPAYRKFVMTSTFGDNINPVDMTSQQADKLLSSMLTMRSWIETLSPEEFLKFKKKVVASIEKGE